MMDRPWLTVLSVCRGYEITRSSIPNDSCLTSPLGFCLLVIDHSYNITRENTSNALLSHGESNEQLNA